MRAEHHTVHTRGMILLEYVVTRLQVTRCYASLSSQSIKHELLYRTAILDVPNLEVV